MNTNKPYEEIADPRYYASVSNRFAAMFLDILIFSAVSIPLTIVLMLCGIPMFVGPLIILLPLFYNYSSGIDTQVWTFYLLWLAVSSVPPIILYIFYGAITEVTKRKATFGKRAMEICVYSTNGEPVPFRRLLLRNLIKAFEIPLFIIFIFVPMFSKRKQALHDMAARTIVVKKVKYYV